MGTGNEIYHFFVNDNDLFVISRFESFGYIYERYRTPIKFVSIFTDSPS